MHTIRNISRIYDSFGNDSGKGGVGGAGVPLLNQLAIKNNQMSALLSSNYVFNYMYLHM